MAIVVHAPDNYTQYHPLDHLSIFLGGSIEQGVASPWQKKVIKYFEKGFDHLLLLNPRRPNWDATWENVKSNPKFAEQVNWELDAIEYADYVIMYFDPATKAPISLLETGLTAEYESPYTDSKLKVVCPKGFYRKGNVDIVCDRYGIDQYTSLKAACEAITEQYTKTYK